MDATNEKLDIVIVGAGLAGLGAAISCALEGHQVTVLEAAKELGEVGAGLQITPNGSRLLIAWGLTDAIKQDGCEATELTIHRYSDGQVLTQQKGLNQKMRMGFGSPFFSMHRGDLYIALQRKTQELGVVIQTNCRVSRVDFEQSLVITEAGRTYSGDLIIGADGLWSKCREALLRREEAPIPTGDLAYRIVLHVDQLQDEELKSLVTNPTVNLWMGPKSHVVAYSIKGATMYNVVLIVPDDLPEHVRRQPASLDEMKALFNGWDPLLIKLLTHVESVDKWKLMRISDLETWLSENGNFALIGDSCHPMLPYLAQGANSAFEDGAALGRALQRPLKKEELPQRLRIWESERKARAEAIVRESLRQRETNHMEDGPQQQARDELFRSQLGKPDSGKSPSRLTDAEIQVWLFSYDAYTEMDKALLKLQ